MTVWLEIGGRERRVELPADALSAGGVVECVVDGRALAVDFAMLQPGVMSLVVGGRQFRCVLDGDAVVGLLLRVCGMSLGWRIRGR